SSAPAPTMPPPTMSRSKRSSARARTASWRQAGPRARRASPEAPLSAATLAAMSSQVPTSMRPDAGSGLGRRRPPGGDPPQHVARPDDQDHDRQRGVEDQPLRVGREDGGENRRSEDQSDGDAGHEQHLPPADRSGLVSHGPPRAG